MKTLIVILFLLSLTAAAVAPVIARNCPAVQIKKQNLYGLENEFDTISKAAARNFCRGKLFSILLAIRKAENGPPGFEFGVVAVKGTSLDKQAGWAAATIVRNYARFRDQIGLHGELSQNWAEDFIDFLALKYCPPSVDFGGHINWIKNVKHWYKKFEAENEK
jgi:hypothetical protein